mgnify:CR=1 FL=1
MQNEPRWQVCNPLRAIDKLYDLECGSEGCGALAAWADRLLACLKSAGSRLNWPARA